MYSIVYKKHKKMSEKIYKRKVVDEILKYINSKDIIVIYGARQVGKTTILKYLMENYLRENVFYFDLELPIFLDLCNQGAENVLKYLIAHELGHVMQGRNWKKRDGLKLEKDANNFAKKIGFIKTKKITKWMSDYDKKNEIYGELLRSLVRGINDIKAGKIKHWKKVNK